MHFLVGDVQGCDDALGRLLAQTGFSPSRDHVHVLGDLVNRGPDNLAVLRRLHALGNACTCLLGNHDLHLLASAQGLRRAHAGDTLADVLQSHEREKWLEWLRGQRLADTACGWLLVHAGVLPQWDAAQVLALAGEVQTLLRGPDAGRFFAQMYGNEPARWSNSLRGPERWRLVVNALTRIRFCRDDGTLELKAKEGADAAPPGCRPWYEVPGRRTEGVPIAFGHWSTLGLVNRPDLLAIDTGCVWGGALTAVRVDGGRREVHQVRCAQAQAPG